VEKGFNYGSRAVVFPFLFYLFKQNYFEKKMSVFRREIPLAVGCLAFFSLADALGNELMWGNNERIVRKYK
jgi:hypothetical protein